MVIIFYIVLILGISGLLTFGVYKIIYKIKIGEIYLPKIKIPTFKNKSQGQIITITSNTPSDNIFQEDIEIEYANGEFRKAVKKQSPTNILGMKHWMVIALMSVPLIMVFYYMKKKR